MNLLGIQEGSKEAPSQRQFTTWLKSDYKEFRRSYKQLRTVTGENPEWGFEHIVFTEYGKELLSRPDPADDTLPFEEPVPKTPAPPEDNPFADPDNTEPPAGQTEEDFDIY